MQQLSQGGICPGTSKPRAILKLLQLQLMYTQASLFLLQFQIHSRTPADARLHLQLKWEGSPSLHAMVLRVLGRSHCVVLGVA